MLCVSAGRQKKTGLGVLAARAVAGVMNPEVANVLNAEVDKVVDDMLSTEAYSDVYNHESATEADREAIDLIRKVRREKYQHKIGSLMRRSFQAGWDSHWQNSLLFRFGILSAAMYGVTQVGSFLVMILKLAISYIFISWTIQGLMTAFTFLRARF